MESIIISLPAAAVSKKISSVLASHGLDTYAICTSASHVLMHTHNLDGGVIVCGPRFPDMSVEELMDDLPETFDILMLVTPKDEEECPEGIVKLVMPCKAGDIVGSVEMLLAARGFSGSINRQVRKKENSSGDKRKSRDRKVIEQAKLLLMVRNEMTEPEAFRYIQKHSMDSGTNMAEMAEMILTLYQ